MLTTLAHAFMTATRMDYADATPVAATRGAAPSPVRSRDPGLVARARAALRRLFA